MSESIKDAKSNYPLFRFCLVFSNQRKETEYPDTIQSSLQLAEGAPDQGMIASNVSRVHRENVG
jgi:hypothetical protein